MTTEDSKTPIERIIMINWIAKKVATKVLDIVLPPTKEAVADAFHEHLKNLLGSLENLSGSSTPKVGYKLLTDTRLPEYIKEGDACMDVFAPRDELIPPKSAVTIMTGIKIQDMPEGMKLVALSRSGLARKAWVFVGNAPGQIDENYRGELGIIIFNFGEYPLNVKKGDAIAQLAIEYVQRFEWVAMDEETLTDRGESGFGSSGMSEVLNESVTEEKSEA
jgi:dUTP pyrophosphatase